MAYGYARFWAGALTAMGTVLVAAGVLSAAAVLLIPAVGGLVATRAAPALAAGILACGALFAGALLGGPLIVAGQSLRVLLAQRALLARLHQRIARLGDR